MASLDCYGKGYGWSVEIGNFIDFLPASQALLMGVRHDIGVVNPQEGRSPMKLKRWIVLPAAGLAAVIIGVAAVEAAPSPSASPTGSKNYAQVFVDKLAGILHLTPARRRTRSSRRSCRPSTRCSPTARSRRRRRMR